MTNKAQIYEFYKKVKFIEDSGNFYLSSHSFEIQWFIGGMEVGKNCQISAQFLQNYAS